MTEELIAHGARLDLLGDSAVVVSFGEEIGAEAHQRVRVFSQLLEARSPRWMSEYVPAFTTVTVIYDARRHGHEEVVDAINDLLPAVVDSDRLAADRGRLVEIPVCYDRDLGPDLDVVASHSGLDPEEVVAIHSRGDYLVYMIGFAPAFPYLGGLSERIATPRRDSPRSAVPAGSVGIAGRQTGIYSIETPGGWQLVGRTPVRLFRPQEPDPSLLAVGDRVRFAPIDRDEYERLREGERR